MRRLEKKWVGKLGERAIRFHNLHMLAKKYEKTLKAVMH